MPKSKRNIYHILLVNHDKQLKDLYYTNTAAKVMKKTNELLKESKKVVFPIRYNNEKTVIVESKYELVIIKVKDETESKVTKVRNEYGKFVNYETSNDDWIVYDRFPYDIEETFWVYGYHPKYQRKTFTWVFDEFIAKDAKNKYMMRTVQVYKNKLLVDCNGKLDMVICKNQSDSIRMYNQLEEIAHKKKLKYVLFMGNVSGTKRASEWVRRIQELTNWNLVKANRPSTRP